MDTLEQLREIGQTSAQDEVRRLEMLYHDLQTQANQHKETFQAALVLRQQYYAGKGEVDSSLKDCNDQLDAVNAAGVAVPTKLDRYKAVVDAINRSEPLFVQLESKAKQIGIEGTASDKQAVKDQVEALRDRAEDLKKRAQGEADEYQKVLSDRQDFSTELDQLH